MQDPVYLFRKYMVYSKEFIIKYQNYNLALDIKLENYPGNFVISTDIEKKEMKLGNNIINFADLKKIYVEIDEEEFRKYIKLRDQYYYYKFMLKIAYQNKTESFTFTIEAKEEIEKLFSYFVFSNEVNEEKYYDSSYLPLHIDLFQNHNEFPQYSEFSVINSGNEEVIKYNNKTYYKKYCVPLRYYDFFYKKSYLLIQNQDINLNYVDVWIESAEIQKMDGSRRIKRLKSEMTVFYIIILIFLFFNVISLLSQFLGIMGGR